MQIISIAVAFNIVLIAAFALGLFMAITGKLYKAAIWIGIGLQTFEYVSLIYEQGLSTAYIPMLIVSAAIVWTSFTVCKMAYEGRKK